MVVLCIIKRFVSVISLSQRKREIILKIWLSHRILFQGQNLLLC